MDPNSGQLPSLLISLVGIVLDILAIVAPTALSDSGRSAILTIATAAIPVGLALYAYFRHQSAMTQLKLRK